MPTLFVPEPSGGAMQSDDGSARAGAFVAETLIQVADTTRPASAFSSPTRSLATQGNDLPTYTLGTVIEVETQENPERDAVADLPATDNRDANSEQTATLPEPGDGETYRPPPPLARPAVTATPRSPVVRSGGNSVAARGRLEIHWSVGKFR